MAVDNRVQLKTPEMFASYAAACKQEKTFSEWFTEDIEPNYSITEDSLSSKLSTEKKNLEIANTTFEYDGEEMTGQALSELRDSDGKKVFKTLRDIAKACEQVEAADMSKFPRLKGGGTRGGVSMDRSSILSDLLEG